MNTLLENIENLLPQTQCRQCGFAGCHAYAQAMVSGQAPINRCAPGGAKGIAKLAAALSVPVIDLDPEYGQEMPFAVARIDARRCIGCHLCAAACPVDVITGTPKHLFAVIETACTGCALCVPACPMDCITLHETGDAWTEQKAAAAKVAFEATKKRRAARQARENADKKHDSATRMAVMQDVMARVRALQKK